MTTSAISERRCAELWDCLTQGGSATVDALTGELVLYPRGFLEELAGRSGDSAGQSEALVHTKGEAK